MERNTTKPDRGSVARIAAGFVCLFFSGGVLANDVATHWWNLVHALPEGPLFGAPTLTAAAMFLTPSVLFLSRRASNGTVSVIKAFGHGIVRVIKATGKAIAHLRKRQNASTDLEPVASGDELAAEPSITKIDDTTSGR